MHKTELPIIIFFKGIWSEYFPYRALAAPMHRAKVQGPARSPTVLETFRADSAKAEAHWLMACSEAPAQIIRTITSQNNFWLNSFLKDIFS